MSNTSKIVPVLVPVSSASFLIKPIDSRCKYWAKKLAADTHASINGMQNQVETSTPYRAQLWVNRFCDSSHTTRIFKWENYETWRQELLNRSSCPQPLQLEIPLTN